MKQNYAELYVEIRQIQNIPKMLSSPVQKAWFEQMFQNDVDRDNFCCWFLDNPQVILFLINFQYMLF